MRNRLSRMLKIVEISQRELESSEQNLKAIHSEIQANIDQKDSLKDYQAEYLEQLKSSKTTTLQEIHRTQAFLGKLNQALEHQQRQIKQLEETLEEAKEFWIEKRTRAKALENLYKKLETKQIVKLEKQEQKMLDDLAASNFNFKP